MASANGGVMTLSEGDANFEWGRGMRRYGCGWRGIENSNSKHY